MELLMLRVEIKLRWVESDWTCGIKIALGGKIDWACGIKIALGGNIDGECGKYCGRVEINLGYM